MPAMRYGREIGRIGFHEQPIDWREPQQVVVGPLLEGDHTGERQKPSGIERDTRERRGSSEAVQNAANALLPCFGDNRTNILRGVSRMHDDRPCELSSYGKLFGERATLLRTRRMIIVVVQSTFTDGDGSGPNEFPQRVRCRRWVVAGGVVRMHASRETQKAGMLRGECASPHCDVDCFADDDNSTGTVGTRACDHNIAIVVEGCVGEVGVRVEKRGHETATAAWSRRFVRLASALGVTLPQSRTRTLLSVDLGFRPRLAGRDVRLAAGIARELALDPEE
jgi:hypothetical protein